MNTITRRKSTLVATAAASALAVGTALVAPAAAAVDTTGTGAAESSAFAVTGGSFTWGINSSFLGYLASPAAGAKITGTGAATYADLEFTFPVDVDDSTIDPAGTAVIALDGGIDLKGHEGKGPDGGWGLDLQYDDLVLTIDGTSAVLHGDYDVSGGVRSGDDVALITFTLAEPIDPATGEFSVTKVATASAQGATDSLGHYPVGTEMAPASLDLNFAGRDTPAPAEGSSSGGLGLLGLLAAVGGVIALIAGAPGTIPGLTPLV